MTQIIPTILTSDLKELKDKLLKLQGLVDWVHLDIMDGKFLENKTVQLKDLVGLKLLEEFKIGLHLMVKDPIKLVESAKSIGVNIVVAQIEMMSDQDEFVKEVKNRGMKSGLALDLKTGIDKINKEVLAKLDTVLIMMVKAGWGGQKLQSERLQEIKRLKAFRQKFKIIVDGGINKENIENCVKAGADILAIGSAIWKSRDIRRRIEKLKSVASS